MTDCPHCSKPLPEDLPRRETATDFPRMDADLRTQIGTLDRRWSLHPFASGWRMVDVAVRAVAVCVLVWLAISLNSQVDAAQQEGQEKLATHRRLLEDFDTKARLTSFEVGQMKLNYQNLHSSTEELFSAQVKDGKLHVILLLAFIAFLAVSAISVYKTHTELAKLRSSFRFLFTYEGRKWLDREAPRQPETPPANAPHEGGPTA